MVRLKIKSTDIIKAVKKSLCNNITDALIKFKKETGICSKDVDIEFLNCSYLDINGLHLLYALSNIEISLAV